MPRSVNPELKDRIERLAAEGDRGLSARELADIVSEVARSLTADLGSLGTAGPVAEVPTGAPAMHGDSGAALDTLRQIGTIDQGDGPLVEIRTELDEIRNATQDAAARYLAAAEVIEGVADRPDIDADDQAAFSQVAIEIFEASTFQDITGQRLTRIAESLRHIEYLLAATKAALGDEEAAESAESMAGSLEQVEQRKVEYILHGPQEAGKANTQEEIDKILASFD